MSWIDKDFQLFNESKKVTPSKIEQKVGETIKLTRESGPNIHDASKTTYTKQNDGTLLKRVAKQTYANITVREKRKSEDPNAKKINEDGFRKREKMVTNILDQNQNQNYSKLSAESFHQCRFEYS